VALVQASSLSLAANSGSNPAGDMDVCLLLMLCVFSGRGLCVGLITRPDESHRVWCVWVSSWSLDDKEALTHKGLLRYEKNVF